ncbi:MAG: C40 family peptidase, partial [bacterium]|nr:C40 family peptidase [bacterium]
SADTDVVSQAIYSIQVEIVATEGSWARIRTPDNYFGWVPSAALHRRDRPYAAGAGAVRVTSLYANLYRERDVTRHAPLLTIPFEARLEVLSEPEEDERRWIEVRLPDDRRAWVHRGDVTSAMESLPVDGVAELALRMTGIPYLWGGTSSFGYDCSGLTQMLYRRRGIEIPRDAGPQSRWEGGGEVSRCDLQPGDLLFFGEIRGKVRHSGMYLGDGRFIH